MFLFAGYIAESARAGVAQSGSSAGRHRPPVGEASRPPANAETYILTVRLILSAGASVDCLQPYAGGGSGLTKENMAINHTVK